MCARSGGPASSLMFCTNGVLLRMLTHGEGLAGVTHIIVDEIHERDRFADFLLILVRRLLPAHPGLRVLLMSATLHTELFSGYFGGCPIVRVCRNSNPLARRAPQRLRRGRRPVRMRGGVEGTQAPVVGGTIKACAAPRGVSHPAAVSMLGRDTFGARPDAQI
jgi:HrpA-like RNA helicase